MDALLLWHNFAGGEKVTIASFWRLLHADMEGLGSRFWITVLVDALLLSFDEQTAETLSALRLLIHADPSLCVEVLETLLPAA